MVNPPSPKGYGAAREEMRELIATVRLVALRQRMLKVWEKLQGRVMVEGGGLRAG